MERTVLVTGSSRGIGLGIAAAFARQGDRVILNGRADGAQLTASVEALRNAGHNVTGVPADMGDYEQARAVIETAGEIDVLVNNAGSAHFGLFTDTRPGDWDSVFRDNFYTTLNATHAAVPGMVRAKRGVIINISSIWGITGASCEGVYAAAKGAVNAFTKSLAKELGPSGVRVNAIACGAFDTRMNARLTPEERRDFTETIPLLRFGQPEEAGALAVYLASDGARYLTGQVIALDGGAV